LVPRFSISVKFYRLLRRPALAASTGLSKIRLIAFVSLYGQFLGRFYLHNVNGSDFLLLGCWLFSRLFVMLSLDCYPGSFPWGFRKRGAVLGGMGETFVGSVSLLSAAPAAILVSEIFLVFL